VFGFLGSEELKKQTSDGSTGNYGMQDQREAMRWVQAHIGSFGGDPSKVTIFGQSAGGNSMMYHLVQSGSYKLYSRVIIESGTYSTGAVPLSDATTTYNNIAEAAQCSSQPYADCLSALDATDLQSASMAVMTQPTKLPHMWGPTVDGTLLTDTPAGLIQSKSYNSAAQVVVGSVRDDMAYFWMLQDIPPTFGQIELDGSLDEDGYTLSQGIELIDVHRDYPSELGGWSKWWWMGMRINTDVVPGPGHCGVRWLADLLLAGGTEAVYTYSFQHPTKKRSDGSTPPTPRAWDPTTLVYHTAEIPYVFAELDKLDAGEEATCARTMNGYWTTFAQSGTPTGAVQWPKYNTSSSETLVFDVASSGGVHTIQSMRKAACDLADKWPGPRPLMYDNRYAVAGYKPVASATLKK